MSYKHKVSENMMSKELWNNYNQKTIPVTLQDIVFANQSAILLCFFVLFLENLSLSQSPNLSINVECHCPVFLQLFAERYIFVHLSKHLRMKEIVLCPFRGWNFKTNVYYT